MSLSYASCLYSAQHIIRGQKKKNPDCYCCHKSNGNNSKVTQTSQSLFKDKSNILLQTNSQGSSIWQLAQRMRCTAGCFAQRRLPLLVIQKPCAKLHFTSHFSRGFLVSELTENHSFEILQDSLPLAKLPTLYHSNTSRGNKTKTGKQSCPVQKRKD